MQSVVAPRPRCAPLAARVASTSRPALSAARPVAHPIARRNLVVRAESEEDFEARLASLKAAKGETGRGGKGKKAQKAAEEKETAKSGPKTYDFEGEEVQYEGKPALGDLITNVVLGATLVWLPLTASAVGRYAFVTYKFTDKRISVITEAPWTQDQSDIAYEEITEVRGVSRGVGLWGDMVVVCRNGDKIEMRAVPEWQKWRDYIQEQIKTKGPKVLTGDDIMAGTGFN